MKKETTEEKEALRPEDGSSSLHTKRLLLQEMNEKDSKQLAVILSRDSVYRTTLGFAKSYDEEHARRLIMFHRAWLSSLTGIEYGVYDRETKELMGMVSVTVNRAHDRGSIAYVIGEGYRSRGIATEALGVFLPYAAHLFSLHKLTASIMESNPASIKVVEKLGFKLEGRLVDEIKKDSKYVTILTYGRLE